LEEDFASGSSMENEFLRFAVEEEIKINVAVIPFQRAKAKPLTQDFVERKTDLLKEGLARGLFEICLHGYAHETHMEASSYSEFAGMPLSVQKEWIANGKRKLCSAIGVEPSVFVPPFNKWDSNTLIALRENSLFVLSAEACKIPRGGDFWSFPYTVTPQDLKTLLDIEALQFDAPIILNIHPHNFRTRLSVDGLEEVKSLLREVKTREYFRLMTFDEAIFAGSVFSGSDLRRLAKAFDWIRFWKPFRFRFNMFRTESVSANRPSYSDTALYILMCLLGLSLFSTGAVCAHIFTLRILYSSSARLWIGILFVCALSYLLWNSRRHLTYGTFVSVKRFVVLAFLIGLVVGTLCIS
jgi:hypothetical protein